MKNKSTEVSRLKRMIINNLKTSNLINVFDGKFNILPTDIALKHYLSMMKKLIGRRLPFIFVIFNNGHASAYVSSEEYAKLGRYFSKKLLIKNNLDVWVKDFKKTADETLRIMNQKPEWFLKSLKDITAIYAKYTVYHEGTKLVFNFFPPNTRQEILTKLEDARKYSEDFYKVSEKKIANVLAFVQKNLKGYSTKDLSCLTAEELALFGSKGKIPSVDELRSRYNKLGGYYDTRFMFLNENEVHSIEFAWTSLHDKKSILGKAAYPGVVRGKCRVIREYHGAEIQSNEILVTGMTDPHFLLLIKKAAAIVTDGGGLLCHAAIIARELKKPCLIGTKIATSVLKDGDVVKVDADKGVLTIIKHKKFIKTP